VWGSELSIKAAKKLERIQTQLAQKPVLWEDVYARASRASQNVKRAEVLAATLRAQGSAELVLNPVVVAFGPVFPARMVHEVSRTEVLAERRRAHSADHAGLEVEEHRAWSALAARDLLLDDVVELRVVVAAVLAVAADAVLAAQHLLKLVAHLVTALARLHAQNLKRRSSMEAGSAREKKGGEERRNLRNSVWQLGTGIRKCG
jgi:hypothetical protein